MYLCKKLKSIVLFGNNIFALDCNILFHLFRFLKTRNLPRPDHICK